MKRKYLQSMFDRRGEEEIWQGYTEVLQEDVAGFLRERGRVLVYEPSSVEERWFTYTADDLGKGAMKFTPITDGSVVVLAANETAAARLTFEACERNFSTAAQNHASFRAGLAAHEYVNWNVTQNDPDSTFLAEWNAAASSERFKLLQGSYNGGNPIVKWVGYVVWRLGGSQHWVLFTANGSSGETKFVKIGIDPNNPQSNNSGPKGSHGTLKFEAHNVTLSANDLAALAPHFYIRHEAQNWP